MGAALVTGVRSMGGVRREVDWCISVPCIFTLPKFPEPAEAANDDSSAARAAMSLLAESKCRRPLDTPFRQQTLKAWRPILTPKVVVLTFFLVGCIFIPIGCVIIAESDKVVEVESADYSAAWLEDGTGGCCESNCDATDGTRVDKNPCTITLSVPEDMAPPIYMYYKLNNFYQNHRRYVKSRSDAQLRGVEGLAPSAIEADCTDVHVHGVDGGPDNISNVVSPCGLISRISPASLAAARSPCRPQPQP